jgi:hypothetical protein
MPDFAMKCLVGAFLLASACANATQPWLNMAGDEWLTLSKEEREAYLSGGIDCYGTDVNPKFYPGQSVMDIAPLVTERYQTGAILYGVEVLSVLETFATPQAPLEVEPHGYFDGDFWRTLFIRPQKDAFVRGYLTCRHVYLKSEVTLPLEDYVNALSDYFGTDDNDPDALSFEKMNTKIGDVLVKLLANRKLESD